jgi:glycosyltransferase involved in cell wall biosynthesis
VAALNRDDGVSFVVPVRNGAAWLGATLDSIRAQDDGRPFEVIVVDDGSDDESRGIVARRACTMPIRLLPGERRGAAAALNLGVRAARHPIVCQVDQDVTLLPGWMGHVLGEFADPTVAAAQGYYATDSRAGVCARVMGLDLEDRYAQMPGGHTDHVCTGNSAYRADALRRVGLFDESLGYGYDNDMSYRLAAAGYRLAFGRRARSIHHWREGLAGYCRQQYGLGYGRLALLAKHPDRLAGDTVSPLSMMLHPVVAAMALGSLAAALVMASAGHQWRWPAGCGALLLLGLVGERTAAGIRAWRRFGDATALLFPVLHLARDLAWVAAGVTWCVRRALDRPASPFHSMRARAPSPVGPAAGRPGGEPAPTRAAAGTRVLVVIPAHNESESLAAVLGEIRECWAGLETLIVDDGSSDGTADLVERLGSRWLRFPERLGIGSAMRAGLRYARQNGYDTVVRLDGDGQHCPRDITRLLAPILEGAADVALGSRYVTPSGPRRPRTEGLAKRCLAAGLSWLTQDRVTDPTSGFCALGPRAVRLLGDHHPTGYPEPELRLFLRRNALRVVEVPVETRSRFAGITSLTPARRLSAGARVVLAMLIVPWRGGVGEAGRD